MHKQSLKQYNVCNCGESNPRSFVPNAEMLTTTYIQWTCHYRYTEGGDYNQAKVTFVDLHTYIHTYVHT
jgi:hypothetical protein